MGEWVSLIASLDAVEKRKIFWPLQESNPSFSAIQPVALSGREGKKGRPIKLGVKEREKE
jgi:hypothetical protein